jgi:hypothetical protein
MRAVFASLRSDDHTAVASPSRGAGSRMYLPVFTPL